jgi:hypothetical protein
MLISHNINIMKNTTDPYEPKPAKKPTPMRAKIAIIVLSCSFLALMTL